MLSAPGPVPVLLLHDLLFHKRTKLLPQVFEKHTARPIDEHMTSHTLRNKAPLVLPPEKGSFPLDREHECSEKGTIYRNCLRENNNSSTLCRPKAKDYFECRMQRYASTGSSACDGRYAAHQPHHPCRGLMQREEWEKIGLGEQQEAPPAANPSEQVSKEQTGWVAGARHRQQRPSN